MASKTVEIRRQRVAKILPLLQELYPAAHCSLNFAKPLELLVATILSAQCTDERVNLTTPALFKRFKTAADYAAAPEGELETLIQSTGFFRAKAKNIRAMGQALLDRHNGKVPQTMDELHALPGVGRKTANVVLGNAFGINVGVTVDTHVGRLSNRLGLTNFDDPVKIEQDLMPIVPPHEWTQWSHLLIYHGRAVCQARRPVCEACALLPHCPAGPKFIQQYAKVAAAKAVSKAKGKKRA